MNARPFFILVLSSLVTPAFAEEGCSLSVYGKIAMCPKTTGTGLCTQESVDTLAYACENEYDVARMAFVTASTVDELEKAGARMKEVTSKIEQMAGLSFEDGSARPVFDEDATIVPVKYSGNELPAELERRKKLVQTPQSKIAQAGKVQPPKTEPPGTQKPPAAGDEDRSRLRAQGRQGDPQTDPWESSDDAGGSDPKEDFGGGSEGSGGDTAKLDDLKRSRVEGSSAKTQGRIGEMSGKINAMNRPEDSGELGASGSGGPAEGKGSGRGPSGGSAGGSVLDLANPKNREQVLLAAAGGYKGSVERAGYQMGRGRDGAITLIRPDGASGAPSDFEAVQRLIQSEPRALIQRPDFFAVLPRDSFGGLKRYYETFPGHSGFKHIGMPGDRRDFDFSQSCARVSGDCNPAVKSASYRKGDFVSPEDLRRIAALMEEDESDSTDGGRDQDGAKNLMKSRVGGSVLSRIMGALSSGWGSMFGARPSSSGSAAAGNSGGREWGPRESVELSGPQKRRSAGQVPNSAEPEPSRNGPGRRVTAAFGLLGAGTAMGFLVWLFLRRRRDANAPPTNIPDAQ